ncbi:hypothetical protein NQ318_010894 [Aromia moschata]|uniref:DUF4817 domain-containing protein n=1 Tax=Aromia moschata TaxID=1265417 RepID=A0AAV8XKS8_9CUCU|nr:hypothetical protein NQ318_010894 [Aromia moschata]
MHKITILQMIGYGDITRTQAEVVRLFQEKYSELPPTSQGTVSKIEKQFRERGHVRQLKKNPPNKLSDDQKLDVMLMLEENPHKSSRQTVSALNISPYKLVPVLRNHNILVNKSAKRSYVLHQLLVPKRFLKYKVCIALKTNGPQNPAANPINIPNIRNGQSADNNRSNNQTNLNNFVNSSNRMPHNQDNSGISSGNRTSSNFNNGDYNSPNSSWVSNNLASAVGLDQSEVVCSCNTKALLLTVGKDGPNKVQTVLRRNHDIWGVAVSVAVQQWRCKSVVTWEKQHKLERQ